jgi:hypothetical protein
MINGYEELLVLPAHQDLHKGDVGGNINNFVNAFDRACRHGNGILEKTFMLQT